MIRIKRHLTIATRLRANIFYPTFVLGHVRDCVSQLLKVSIIMESNPS